MYYTTSGGASWEMQVMNSDFDDSIYGISHSGANALAVSDNGWIYKYGG
jgi:hypothetical protein